MTTVAELQQILGRKRAAAVRHHATGQIWNFTSATVTTYTSAGEAKLVEVLLTNSAGKTWAFLDDGQLTCFTGLDSERPRFKETDGFSADDGTRWSSHLGKLFDETILYDLASLTGNDMKFSNDDNFILVSVKQLYNTDNHKEGLVVSFEGAKGILVSFDLTTVPAETLPNISAFPSRKTAGGYDPKVIGR